MPISFRCTECDGTIRVRDEGAGKSIKCPHCETKIKVPFPDEDEELEELPLPKRSSAAKPVIRKTVKKKREASGESSIWGKSVAGVLCALLFIGGTILRVSNRAFRNAGQNANHAAQPAPGVGSPLFAAKGAEPNALATLPEQIGNIALPQFPELTVGKPVGSKGVTMQTVAFTPPANAPLLPGGRMKVRVYLPPGNAPQGTLPCVLVAPAGTPLITGNSLDGEDYHDETLPYAEAGIVAVMYELDGGLQDETSNDKVRAAYLAFSAAAAGLVNARNAFEFVVAKIPQVNPDFIYAAGHSSAGTTTLLFAAHEPRLAACMAFAPCTNVPSRLQKLINDPSLKTLLPGIDQFVVWSSPSTYLNRTRCPMQIIQARDDSNVPIQETEEFVKNYRSVNHVPVFFEVLPSGDHYQGLLSQAIPKAIFFIETSQKVLKKHDFRKSPMPRAQDAP